MISRLRTRIRGTIFCATAFLGWWLTSLPSIGADVASLKPPSREELEQSIRHGLDFLLKTQNKDGSWGSARRTKDLNIFAPVPGAHQAFRSAVTGLCIEALVETGATTNDAARQSLERAEEWLLQYLPEVRRADGVAIYNVWAHAYGVQALVRMHRRATNKPARQRQIIDLIGTQMDLLQRYESVDGGWGYYDFRIQSKRPATDSTSFVNAAVLIACYEAQQIGAPVPQDMVKRAVAATLRQRKNDFSYLYGEYLKYSPMMLINRPAGSLGRSQSCNLALKLWGDTNVTVTVMTNWLDRLFARNEWLSFGRKRPIPHESYFQVAGYFFYYGHYYAARVIDQLDAPLARRYQGLLAAIVVPLQETDGSWWDYPFYDYHQPYGTAYALTTLAWCRERGLKASL